MTGREVLRAAIARLRAAGVADPVRDARRLLAHALEIDPARLTLAEGDALDPAQDARFDAAITARAARQPVSQITGWRDFHGHRFRVTRDTLDPRPETETLVEAASALPWQSVLDLGTGTGAILISLLAARPTARGLGVDVSPAALDIAGENARRLGVSADFLLSDWFGAVTGRFDLITSNPPYIALAEMADLSAEVRDWEPHLALTDGGDGLQAYRLIAAGMWDHLTPGGRVLVEIGGAQADDVVAIFAAMDARTQVLTDLDGRDRVISACFAAE